MFSLPTPPPPHSPFSLLESIRGSPQDDEGDSDRERVSKREREGAG